MTPSLITTLQNLNDYIDNYYIAQDLKQYRPQRKPLTKTQLQNVSKKTLKSESFKRKRKNIVRDWLYFIVWYVRLKRILYQHKRASQPPTAASLLSCHERSKQSSSLLKSPIQDPTQLTETGLAVSLPMVQFRIFESSHKMEEFFIISPGRNSMRLSPLSLNASSLLIS